MSGYGKSVHAYFLIGSGVGPIPESFKFCPEEPAACCEEHDAWSEDPVGNMSDVSRSEISSAEQQLLVRSGNRSEVSRRSMSGPKRSWSRSKVGAVEVVGMGDTEGTDRAGSAAACIAWCCCCCCDWAKHSF